MICLPCKLISSCSWISCLVRLHLFMMDEMKWYMMG
jgi:hypothetical protein